MGSAIRMSAPQTPADPAAFAAWLERAREYLANDDTVESPVDVVHGLYTAFTGDNLDHPDYR